MISPSTSVEARALGEPGGSPAREGVSGTIPLSGFSGDKPVWKCGWTAWLSDSMNFRPVAKTFKLALAPSPAGTGRYDTSVD